ncbi:hypothetical protein AYI68_g6820 [Smittium mucronatum]|uniref:Uncharacterized protein n=1 Tax=Smittium mucronatum TaxID=133383 RepID=A0A1R0GQG0_9FUNG|nr:hypothetical protein AYI68_g6820 [Smittium mucronatum]
MNFRGIQQIERCPRPIRITPSTVPFTKPAVPKTAGHSSRTEFQSDIRGKEAIRAVSAGLHQSRCKQMPTSEFQQTLSEEVA